MTAMDRLERDLTVWLEETAMPARPDYTDDLLRKTAATRQRARWTFPSRWLPRRFGSGVGPSWPVSWRMVVLLALLALLVAATIAVYVGSQRRLPAPFGPASNGLVAYTVDDDIYLVDPETGLRTAVVTGKEIDSDPRFSRDGTRIAFLRDSRAGSVLMATNLDGSTPVVSQGPPFRLADSDSISWSPDGGTIALAADASDGGRTIHLVDTADGSVTEVTGPYFELEAFWRPPHGRELLFAGGSRGQYALYLYSLETGRSRLIEGTEGDESIRPAGFAGDGRFVVYYRDFEDNGLGPTRLVDLETRATGWLRVGFGRVSNDGTRVAGMNGLEQPCVVVIPDIECRPLQAPQDAFLGDATSSLQWSPDDRWLLAIPPNDRTPYLLDPNGGPWSQPAWLAEGAASWQRRAP